MTLGARPGLAARTDALGGRGLDDGGGEELAPLAWLGGGDDGGGTVGPVPAHLESRFGAAGLDVSGVRLHTGPAAEDAAGRAGARAFAVGQDVHFGAGEYQPGTPAGDHLIAHELAHTVQQRGGDARPQFQLRMSQPTDDAEREADQFADAIVNGDPRAAGLPGLRAGSVPAGSVIAREVPGATAPAAAATFTDEQFAAVLADGIGQFRRAAGTRPISSLFTPEEQRAVAAYLTDRHLPPVGTFSTFFTTAPEPLRFVFAAGLHVNDRSRVVRGRDGREHVRGVRANDCGDWVGRVVTYARNEPYVSRAERRRNHLASPDSLYRYGRGNQLLAEAGEGGIRSHRAVDQSIVERLAPGDWVMIHWHHGTRPGEDNHSMMFIEWVDRRWRADGYRRARFAHQGNNDLGGGQSGVVPICADASKNRYVYNVRSQRPFNEEGHPGADAAPAPAAAEAHADPAAAHPHANPAAAEAHAAPAAGHAEPAAAAHAEPAAAAQAEPAAHGKAIPDVLQPFVEAHPEKVVG